MMKYIYTKLTFVFLALSIIFITKVSHAQTNLNNYTLYKGGSSQSYPLQPCNEDFNNGNVATGYIEVGRNTYYYAGDYSDDLSTCVENRELGSNITRDNRVRFTPSSAGSFTISLRKSTQSWWEDQGGNQSNYNAYTTSVSQSSITVYDPLQFSSIQVCNQGATIIDLDDYTSEPGISYSGDHINSNGVFDATGLSAGTYSVTAAKSYDNGNRSRSLTVNVEQPNFTFNAIPDRCVNGSTIYLQGLTSVSTTFSGDGVSGNNFDPSSAGTGTHTISATYENGAGCERTKTRNVTVHGLTNVNAGGNFSRCINDAVVNLSGSPSGGSWSGTGISGSTFNPSAAGAGQFTLTYTYTNGNSCTSSDTRTVTVESLTDFTFNALPDVCENASNVNLQDFTSRTTIFSGTGVSGAVFNPSTNGSFTITASYTNGNGCTKTRTRNITVLSTPDFNFSGLVNICRDDDPVNLQPFTDATTNFSGTGVVSNSFLPNVAGIGTHNITASYTGGNGCSISKSRSIIVVAEPAISAGADESVCSTDAPILLTGSPTGGSWSGDGIINGNEFDPGQVPSGSTAVLTYSYNNGTCSRTDEKLVTVKNSPVITFSNSHLDVCVYSGGVESTTFDLTDYNYNPTGGSWASSNSEIDDAISGTILDLSVLEEGSIENAQLTYSYTSGGNCTSSENVTITINKNSGEDIMITEDDVCGNGVMSLTAAPLTDAINFEYVWYNDSDLNSIIRVGNELTTPNLTSTTRYWAGIRNINTQCISTLKSAYATVNAIPVVDAGPNEILCSTNESIQLSIGATPSAGGIWSGPGIDASGEIFDASLVGEGTYELTYSYSDPNTGCSATDSRQIQVGGSSDSVDAGGNVSTCHFGGEVSLNGTPAGGTWSSANSDINNAINNSNLTINVDGIAPGTYFLTYSKVSSTQCVLSDVLELSINANPDIPIPNHGTICGQGTVTLSVDGIGDHENVRWFQNADDTTPFHVGGSYTTPSISSSKVYYINKFNTNTGCVSEKTEIRANIGTAPTVNAGADLSFCEDNISYNLSQDVNNPGGVWTGDGVEGSVFVGGMGSGTYNVTYTLTNDQGCSASDSRIITIGLEPEISTDSDSIITSEPVQFFTNIDNIQTIEWSFGDGLTSNAEEPFHYYYEPGLYTVEISILLDNGCSGDYTFENFVVVNGQDLNIVTGNGELETDRQLNIFPNPINSSPLKMSSKHDGSFEVELHNIAGRKILSKKLSAAVNDLVVILSSSEVQSLESGTYILVVIGKDQVTKRKINKL